VTSREWKIRALEQSKLIHALLNDQICGQRHCTSNEFCECGVHEKNIAWKLEHELTSEPDRDKRRRNLATIQSWSYSISGPVEIPKNQTVGFFLNLTEKHIPEKFRRILKRGLSSMNPHTLNRDIVARLLQLIEDLSVRLSERLFRNLEHEGSKYISTSCTDFRGLLRKKRNRDHSIQRQLDPTSSLFRHLSRTEIKKFVVIDKNLHHRTDAERIHKRLSSFEELVAFLSRNSIVPLIVDKHTSFVALLDYSWVVSQELLHLSDSSVYQIVDSPEENLIELCRNRIEIFCNSHSQTIPKEALTAIRSSITRKLGIGKMSLHLKAHKSPRLKTRPVVQNHRSMCFIAGKFIQRCCQEWIDRSRLKWNNSVLHFHRDSIDIVVHLERFIR